MTRSARQRRTEDIRRRASKPDPMYTYCRVIGCPNSTTTGTGSGLNRKYCRRHEDHFERHGSYTKPSYRRSDIDHHRKAALKWLTSHASSPQVRLALAGIEQLYRQSGPKVEAFRLRGMKPEERAWAAWARLRDAKVDPIRPLAAWLAVEAAIAADPQPENRREYKLVQAAKLVHRMASGSHRRWERELPSGKVKVEELHRYPHSRGRILRHIGSQLERIAGGLGATFQL